MGRSVRTGFDRSDVWRGVVALLASIVGLALAGWILPGIDFDGWWPVVLVALVMAVEVADRGDRMGTWMLSRQATRHFQHGRQRRRRAASLAK